MSYDPFERGPYPVGVRTNLWHDDVRDRGLPVEIWYPATEQFAGKDLDPSTQDSFVPGWAAGEQSVDVPLAQQAAVRNADIAQGPHDLVLLVHGWAGYRREATFIGTHLASHGYVVVSPDVVSSTFADVDAFLDSVGDQGEPTDLDEHVSTIAHNRKGDVAFLVDTAMANFDLKPGDVGITGASFGGWMSLDAPALDSRIAASVPMCPAGGRAPVDDGVLSELLDWNWRRDVPTLMLTADRDSLLPLYGQLELLRRIPSTDKRMVVLADADHNHFVDDIDTGQQWLREFANRVAVLFPRGPGDWTSVARSVAPAEQLCPGASAQLAWRGLITAHMDAHLRANSQARELLRTPLDRVLADRGVRASTVESGIAHPNQGSDVVAVGGEAR